MLNSGQPLETNPFETENRDNTFVFNQIKKDHFRVLFYITLYDSNIMSWMEGVFKVFSMGMF